MFEMIRSAKTELLEVFKTNAGTVYQSDKQNCLFLNFAGKFYKLSYQSIKDLKKTIDNIDLEYICTHTQHADIEIFFLKEHCFILTGIQVVALKEILQGTFAMFRLNHIVKDCLHRLVIC